MGIFKNVSIIYRVCKPQYAAISRDTPKNLPQQGNKVHSIFVFLRNDSKLYNSYELATKEIWAVYYFNNNALEKCTNGKAFNTVTIAHFVYLPNLQF